MNVVAGPRVRPAEVRAGHETGRWERLVEIKTAWGPDNVFRIDHDVPPRAGSTR